MLTFWAMQRFGLSFRRKITAAIPAPSTLEWSTTHPLYGTTMNMPQEKNPGSKPAPELPVIQSRRLYKQIADILASHIRDGLFPAGSYLPSERDLATQMNVSRPSVREALIALEVMGLVSVRVGDGVLVRAAPNEVPQETASENSPLEQLQARLLLEGEIAALAATHATPEQRSVLEAALDNMQASIADRTRFLEQDEHFHFAIAAASGNQTLVDLVTYLWKQRSLPLYRSFEAHFTGASEQASVLEEHRIIVDAIRCRDADRARQAMHTHISRVIEQLALG